MGRLEQTHHSEDVLMEKKHMKRCSTSEQPLKIIGEMKIKTERRFHYTSIRMVKIKKY